MTHKNRILLILIALICFSAFYSVNWYMNYPVHRAIRMKIINHPEFIPTANTVKISASGFQNVVADSYWLSAVQYIGSNAISSEYKKYLFVMINLITDLNPYFTYPYRIGLLLIPSYNENSEKLTPADIKKYNDEAVLLGLKGIETTCNKEKIALISNEYDLKKLWTEEKYKNPCRDSNIPYFLAYIYYWNLHDGASSSKYYRIASANDSSPKGARTMAAIMQGKSGDREKAITMFLSLAESLGGKNSETCQQFSHELGKMLLDGFSQKLMISGKFLKQIETYRQDIENRLGEKDELKKGTNIDDLCSNYLNKAVRELNLAFLENADTKYFNDKKEHAVDAKMLFDKKYIDYFPRDYHREDAKNEIIYYYNPETQHWDSKMGEY